MPPATLNVTKLLNSFIGDDGNKVDYETVEIEFAPNCFAVFKFNANNQRVLQKYNPNMYQFLCNLPHGQSVEFKETRVKNIDGITTPSGISGIYSKQENEL